MHTLRRWGIGSGLAVGLVLFGEELKWGRVEWDPSKPKPFEPTGPALDVTLPIFEKAARHARDVRVWEGLPHHFEKELLEHEKKRTSTVRLHDDLFYPTARMVDGPQAETFLQAIMTAALPFRGIKLCGGFHADYAVTWENGAERCTARVCFGCQEIKFNTPQGETIADMSGPGRKALSELFEPFKKERPPRNFGKVTPPAK